MTTHASASTHITVERPRIVLVYAIVPWLAYTVVFVLYMAGYRPLTLGIAGVVLCIFGPGFALLPVMFGGQASFDAAEVLALAAPLSLAVGGIVGVALTYTPQGLRYETYFGGLFLFTSICLEISILRRNKGETQNEPACRAAPTGNHGAWRQHNKLTASLNVGLAVLMLSGAGALAFNMQQPTLGPYFTEFYLLDANDRLVAYPDSPAHAEPMEVRYGITSREARTATYQVCVAAEDQPLTCVDPVVLRPTQSWEGPIKLDIPEVIDKPMQIRFVLLRAQAVYRTLHLWVYPSR